MLRFGPFRSGSVPSGSLRVRFPLRTDNFGTFRPEFGSELQPQPRHGRFQSRFGSFRLFPLRFGSGSALSGSARLPPTPAEGSDPDGRWPRAGRGRGQERAWPRGRGRGQEGGDLMVVGWAWGGVNSWGPHPTPPPPPKPQFGLFRAVLVSLAVAMPTAQIFGCRGYRGGNRGGGGKEGGPPPPKPQLQSAGGAELRGGGGASSRLST